MVWSRTDNRTTYKMDTEEQKTAGPWMDRVYKDLTILGIMNDEELTTERDAWRSVVVVVKDLNSLYWAKKKVNFFYYINAENCINYGNKTLNSPKKIWLTNFLKYIP